LKLEYGELLSRFAFKFNLRRYISAVRVATYGRLQLVSNRDFVKVSGGAYGPWSADADANMATALALGAARVAAATAGSMCIYPATLAGSEDAWEAGAYPRPLFCST
jgi:hypothetical protein